MKYYFRILALPTIFFLLLNITLYCQQEQPDTKGKKFYVAFMENLGNNGNNSKLRLYAACEQTTTVKVTFLNDTNNKATYNITRPNTPIEITISSLLELASANQGVSNKSILVESDKEITLYGINIRDKSADAFVALPLDVLSPNYIILADSNGYTAGINNGSYDTQSQFACVAMLDSTTLNITPSKGLYLNGKNNDSPFKVNLQKGEVFFGQARTGIIQDVSGTEVLANKPVAVFAGVKRSSKPVRLGRSRDQLCEQMIPVENWGKNYIVTPHFITENNPPFDPSFRIIAAYDNTNWSINGVPQPPLKRAVPVGMSYTSAMFIKSDQPVLIAQYEPSSSANAGGGGFGQFSLSDPFMMIIPPVEQYDTSNIFQSIIDPEFSEHYINVTAHKNSIDRLFLDGQKISSSLFINVGNTDYKYAQVSLKGGSHIVKSDSAFGLAVYGYGDANSYGYTGSMVFKKLVFDTHAPTITDTSTCGGSSGAIFDDKISDSGIDTVELLKSVNINFILKPFKKYVDTVYYSTKLIDPYQDGYYSYRVKDSMGNANSMDLSIPGVTLRAVGMVSAPITLDTVTLINGNVDTCRVFEIENYGSFPHTISEIKLSDSLNSAISNGKIKILGGFPRVINPKEKAQFQICFSGAIGYNLFTTPIFIQGFCSDRQVANLTINNIIDTLPPEILKNIENCRTDINYVVTEPTFKGIGIAEINFDELINCKIPVMPDKTKFSTGRVEFKVSLKNKFQDGFIKFTTKDKIGNSITQADTIRGFTVVAQNRTTNKELGNRFGEQLNLDTLSSISWRCDDSIKIFNYGLKPMVVANIYFIKNTYFSLPPSMLPITIMPNSYTMIPVCLNGSKNDIETDSMVISNGCDVYDTVAMNINMQLVLNAGSDWCKNLIDFNIKSNSVFISSIYPNPLKTGTAKAYAKFNEPEMITFKIYNSLGVCINERSKTYSVKQGITEIFVDLGNLQSGAYTLIYKTSTKTFLDKLVISR